MPNPETTAKPYFGNVNKPADQLWQDAAMEANRLRREVAKLKASLEAIGEASGICVASDIGRTCRYCQCGASEK